MRKKSLVKDASREIQKSLGRFFSIMLIVALGVAFLAGIKVTSPMMRDMTDGYMDQYQMMDLSILSTLGIEVADVDAIGKLEQVEQVVGSYSMNALATIEGRQSVVKVHSLEGLSEDKTTGINQPKLVEGRWPTAPNECLIDGGAFTRLPLQIGDTITLEGGNEEAISDALEHESYEVVGIIHSPYYMHHERGSAEAGDGSVDSFIYIPKENFKSEIYTELFITVKNARQLNSYSQTYQVLMDEVKAQIEPLMKERASVRYEKLLLEGKGEIAEGELRLKEEKEKANKALEDAAMNLEKGETEILKSEKDLLQGEIQAQKGFREAEAALKEADLQLTAQRMRLEEADVELLKGREHLEGLKLQLQIIEEALLTAAETEVEALLLEKQGLEGQIVAISSQLQVQEQEIVEGKRRVQEGEKNLEQQKLILANEKEATLKKLASGQARLEEGKKGLEEGKVEYATSKEEAYQQLEEAEKELAEGREALENLKEPKVYVLGRGENYGFANYKNAVDTIERIGRVFPIFFFVVAALVCLTTMTRMVDEQRITIGTYKALGYSTWDVMSKYVLYAGMASVMGSILGIIVGFRVFPHTIYNAYGTMFTVPPLVTKFYPREALSAVLVMTLLTTFAAVWTTMKVLKEQPTELMRPKAPPAGKRIFLERIPFIWTRMNFFQKVVARNIFRYKKKFFMTTIGIAGCTALLVAGLGLKQSITSIVDRQYGQLFQYDLEVSLSEEGLKTLEEKEYVKAVLEVSNEQVKVRNAEEERSATLRSVRNIDTLPSFITLRERISQEPLTLEKEGVILTEKLAKALDIQVGDTIQFETSDLEAFDVKVLGITENYIGHAMYMSATYHEKVRGEVPKVNQLLMQLNDISSEKEETISEALIQEGIVTSFTFTTKHKANFDSITDTLDKVVIILVVSAALLAFIVLYNLTTINISERYREIATIKVLGFNDFKVSQYIYRENVVLTLIGALLGLGLGKALFSFIIVTAEMDEMMFGREIYGISYLIAFVLTFLFAMLVNVLMHFKLQKIEMVESLKSVE